MTEELPHPWLRSERPVPRLILRPLERFLSQEAGSAVLLIVAAVAGLLWANLGTASYQRLWMATIKVDIGGFVVNDDLRHVVNELLMAVFFYVVALEVKREALFGALREVRTAAVPAAAALGTMVGAAAAYVAVNAAGGDLRGWAIPIATDIAFALGVLGLVGTRAPRALRAFLLTLAVVDDLATIVVIAVVFTDDLSLAWLAAAVGCVLLIVAARRVGIRSLVPYVLLAGALWLAVFESGIHATIAGVVLGLLTPAVAWYSPQSTGAVITEQLSRIPGSDHEIGEGTLLETARLATEAVSPLRRMEHQLGPWTAFLVLPLFALANAGVPVSIGDVTGVLTTRVGLGIVLGLVLGAPLGGIIFAWSIVRSGLGRVPPGLDWPAIVSVTPLKGIGFTIAIFISSLTFDEPTLQDQATVAILAASAAAALIGLAVLGGRPFVLNRRRRQRSIA